jgi:predicted metal-dependent hydrolase
MQRMQLELPLLIDDADPRTDPADLPAGVRLRQVTLGGRSIRYMFRRARRRTIGLLIDEHGLSAAAPQWVPIAEVEAFMREKERWIVQRLAERTRDTVPAFQWREGAALPYLGRDLALAVSRSVSVPRAEAGLLHLPAAAAAPARMRDMTLAWIKGSALALYRERADMLASRSGVAVKEVRLSSARTQWGSCTVGGRIRINWRLMHFAPQYIDYVIAHELAHLVEMNHSRAFWRVVGSMYPDYQAARGFLRRRGHLIPVL